MTQAGGRQQRINQPTKGSSKVGGGSGSNSNIDASGNNGGSSGGKDNNDTTKNNDSKLEDAFNVGRGDATMGGGGCDWRPGG